MVAASFPTAKAAARRTFAGTPCPSLPPWPGTAGTTRAPVLPEGGYTARLDVLYVNGNNPRADSPVITIDVTAPTAAAKPEYEIFSPNGDGNKDVVTIFQETSEETGWAAIIRDERASSFPACSGAGAPTLRSRGTAAAATASSCRTAPTPTSCRRPTAPATPESRSP